MPRAPTAVYAALVLLAALPALPGRAAPRLVVDRSASGDPAAVLAPLRAAFGPAYDADVVDLHGALDAGAGPWAFTAPAVVDRWPVEPITGPEVTAAMAEIEAAMQEVDYVAAQGALEDLERRLAACPDPIPPSVLARVPFLLGIIHYYAGDADAARASFHKAAERRPDMDWDSNFAPEPQQIFLGGLADAVRSPRTTLSIDPGDRPVRLLVDGFEVPVGQRELEVVGEEHLVQFGEHDGPLVTLVLRTGGAEHCELLGPRAVDKGLAVSPDSVEGRPAFEALLAQARRTGHTEVLVVDGPGAEMAWRYDQRVGAWSRVSLVLGHKLGQARGFQAAGGLMIGVGAAVAVTGTVLGLTSFGRGTEVSQLMMLQDGSVSPGLYDLHHEDYERYRQEAGAGWTMLAVGGTLLAAGIPLSIHGASIQREAMQDPGILMAAGPTGFVVGLRGDF